MDQLRFFVLDFSGVDGESKKINTNKLALKLERAGDKNPEGFLVPYVTIRIRGFCDTVKGTILFYFISPLLWKKSFFKTTRLG